MKKETWQDIAAALDDMGVPTDEVAEIINQSPGGPDCPVIELRNGDTVERNGHLWFRMTPANRVFKVMESFKGASLKRRLTRLRGMGKGLSYEQALGELKKGRSVKRTPGEIVMSLRGSEVVFFLTKDGKEIDFKDVPLKELLGTDKNDWEVVR
ncbi:MAG: hypothetical protein J6Y62_04580 [Clostridia bacterium]|nr:hypothetical protein [Clostridia bacterium]